MTARRPSGAAQAVGSDLRRRARASWARAAAFALLLAATGLVFALLRPFLQDLPWIAILSAGLLYLTSHGLRAVRLALLSIDLLGVSGRTAALMHLATAPIALVLPFKSGELLRLHELWRLSGAAVYAAAMLLIDRMFDAIFLVPLLVILLSLDSAPAMLAAFTLFAAVVPLTIVVVGPRILTELQHYIVATHNNPRVLEVLRHIDAVRVVVTHAAHVAGKRAPELCVISFLVWSCELLACLMLVNGTAAGVFAEMAEAFDLLGSRLSASWWNMGDDPLLRAALAVSTVVVMLPWPVVAMVYLARRRHEPRRVPATAHAMRSVAS
ncbi:MAG: hypothetical protein AAF192_00160 [Pseudomonadota bacterium]